MANSVNIDIYMPFCMSTLFVQKQFFEEKLLNIGIEVWRGRCKLRNPDYGIYPKYSDSLPPCHTFSKLSSTHFTTCCLKSTGIVANCVDPDQNAAFYIWFALFAEACQSKYLGLQYHPFVQVTLDQ